MAFGVEKGIFQQVVDHLLNELCIHGNHDEGAGDGDADQSVREPLAETLYSLGNDFL